MLLRNLSFAVSGPLAQIFLIVVAFVVFVVVRLLLLTVRLLFLLTEASVQVLVVATVPAKTTLISSRLRASRLIWLASPH